MTNPVAPCAQYDSRRSQRALQVRIGLTLLGCILYLAQQIHGIYLWLGFGPRYVLTNDGHDAIHPQFAEISLEDWARVPSCDLCGQPSALGLTHSDCDMARSIVAAVRSRRFASTQVGRGGVACTA